MHRLRRIPFFATLSEEEMGAIYAKMQARHFGEGEVVFKEGDPGDALYLIEQGMVKVVSDAATEAEVFAHLSEGDFFGEMALLSNRVRSSAVIAVSPVDLLILPKADFEAQIRVHPTLALSLSRTLSQRLIHSDQALVQGHLRKMVLFADVSDEEILAISRRLQPKQYKKGWLIFSVGEPATSLYLIEKGQVRVISDAETERETIAVLGEGEFFGEMALLTGEPRTAAVRAMSDLDLWVLSKADFEDILVAYPPIGLALSRVLGSRLETADHHLVQHGTETRLAPLPSRSVQVVLPSQPRPATVRQLGQPPALLALKEAAVPLQSWFQGQSVSAQSPVRRCYASGRLAAGYLAAHASAHRPGRQRSTAGLHRWRGRTAGAAGKPGNPGRAVAGLHLQSPRVVFHGNTHAHQHARSHADQPADQYADVHASAADADQHADSNGHANSDSYTDSDGHAGADRRRP